MNHVLIETLWNVKKITPASKNFGDLVLIETLWNVKTGRAVDIMEIASGINRNIVECKVKKKQSAQLSEPVLIETLWNVKTLLWSRQCSHSRINRNIVECKDAARRDKEAKLVPY